MGLKGVLEVVVGVIKKLKIALCLTATLFSLTINAATVPKDRIDVLYHSYKGGGAKIDGPSILVRKKVADNISLRGNYYADIVSSASIDVIATASPYTEERTEFSAGLDYSHNKTLMSLNYTGSNENDYNAKTIGFSISQDFFGDMSNLSLGYSVGQDTVRQNGNDIFEEDLDRQQLSLAFSQIITKNLVANIVVESIIDEGFLNNPYRQVRYLDTNAAAGFSYEPERYPGTRNSDAVAFRGIYHLPWHSAIRGEYRRFSDSWGIGANTAEVSYIHPWRYGLTFEVKYRQYTQSQADFFSDLFPYQQAQNFLARDKELSAFSSTGFGLGVSYKLPFDFWDMAEKSSINLFWDHLQFNYDSFRDVTAGGTPGTEPLYSFDADIIRLFLSVWY